MQSERERRRRVDASLLRAIVDQFIQRAVHPPRDIREFEQLALGLIDIVDSETAALILQPLCFNPETPASIFARLFDKGGACAQLAFQYAPTAPARDTLATAEHGPSSLAVALAHRSDLDRETIALLASRSEHEVLRALAANRATHFDASARRALTQAARDDAILARTLLDRDDLDMDAEPLFLAATRLERSAIILNACRRILAQGAMGSLRRADATFVARLELAALRRNRDEMAVLFADALDCRKDRARAIICDPLGEALALALTTVGVDEAAAIRIFLCADIGIAHDADRVRALVALMRATPQAAAARIVNAIVGLARSESELARRPAFRNEAQLGAGCRRAPRDLGGFARAGQGG